MRKTKESVYRCDHCNRAIVSKGSMALHERMCKKNPNNQHQCFEFCNHLNKEEAYNGEISFTCYKRPDIELYSYKLERFKSKAERMIDKERMPLQCELYESNHYIEDL